MTAPQSNSSNLIKAHLSCPNCHGDLIVEDAQYQCLSCNARGDIKDGVFLTKPLSKLHYFDDKFEVMQEGNEADAIWQMCYEQQSKIARDLIKPGNLVVDIGCGPSIHFDKPNDCVLIGVDPSFESIRANRALDLAVYGGAETMPLKDKSVDRLFMFYAIHHMIGQTVHDNTANLSSVLKECGRVVRGGGDVVIFDMSPWWPAWHAQRMVWNKARGTIGEKLDMFFWRAGPLERLARSAFTAKSFTSRSFGVSPFLVFPPVFSIPKLKVPRMLYPFDIKMYKWSF
jgi:ubiquinone/menaquinone biosynthesis C-methylase UbiE